MTFERNGSGTTPADVASDLAKFTDAPDKAEPAAPVVVREEVKPRPKNMQVASRRIYSEGKFLGIEITPKPGNAITRIFLTDIRHKSKLCRVGILTERRRGRPATSQRKGEE